MPIIFEPPTTVDAIYDVIYKALIFQDGQTYSGVSGDIGELARTTTGTVKDILAKSIMQTILEECQVAINEGGTKT